MSRIGFILMHVFLVAISQDVLAESNDDYELSLHGIGEDEYSISEEDLPDLRNSNIERNTFKSHQECSCTYDYLNGFVKARLGHRLLKKRDSIMRGETVSFECRYVSTVLIWENGLRFYGRANMTCNTCEKWQKQHLPSCRSAQQFDVVLGQEDDLAVLPGGTVQLETGQSRRFSCSNIWRQPEWVYRGKDGISVKNAEDSGERETIFVSYLDITDAEDKHSGIYECFSRTPAGHQTLSNFLHIEVVRKSEIDGTASSTSPETGVSPTKSTTSTTTWEFPDDGNNRECSCEYDFGDTRVNAYLGYKRLQMGDTIRRGDTVSFFCSRRHVLSWENGLRYQGKANITCSKCEIWTDTDLPTCRLLPLRRYTLISSEKALTFLPGGTLQMREGESYNISCLSARSEPQWKYETKDNVAEWISNREPHYYRSYLEVKHVKYDNKGKYECITATGESVVLNLEVDGKSIGPANCSKFPDQPGLRVLYSGFSVGSVARFRCSPPSRYLNIRSSKSVCLEGGTWSNPVPMCEGNIGTQESVHRDERPDVNEWITVSPPGSTVLKCSKFPDHPGLLAIYSGFSIGSTARFRCSSGTLSGSSISTCLPGGTWSNPAPMCDGSTVLNCSKFPDHPGLLAIYSGFSNGSIARFRCSPGKLSGSSYSTCLPSGTWSNPAPMCDAPKCSMDDLIISLPQDVILDKPNGINEFSPGSEVQLTCKNSLMDGDSKALCGVHGRWKIGNLECTPGCRLDVNPSSKLRVEPRKDIYRFGEFIFLSCPLRYQLSNEVERLMCLSNSWSDDLPECIPAID